jgi:hypothetical protein
MKRSEDGMKQLSRVIVGDIRPKNVAEVHIGLGQKMKEKEIGSKILVECRWRDRIEVHMNLERCER